MYLSEKSVSQKAGRAGIVLGLHALFAVGLVTLGAGGVIEKIRESSITIIPPTKTTLPPPDTQKIPDTKLETIVPNIPETIISIKTPPIETTTITTKAPIAQTIDSRPPLEGDGNILVPVKPVERDPVFTIALLDKNYLASFQPAYPASARRADIEGVVSVRVRIDTNGLVISARIEKSSSHEVLDTAALQHALKKWRFTPATRDGKPIEAERVIKVVFELKHEA
jgi:protein TonB